MKNQKVKTAVIGGLVALVTSTLVSQYLRNRSDPTSDVYLSKVASEINKSLPMMVDGETELYSVIGINKSIQYNYRLTNLVQQNIPLDDISKLKTGMINRNCTTPETRDNFLKKGIKMVYKYYDKNKIHLIDIEINPSDCK